eukprot:scaffold106563_cov60-Phaeocystis_antarctica.AAC.3
MARTTLPTGTQSCGKYEGSAMTTLVRATTSCTLMPHATPPSYSTVRSPGPKTGTPSRSRLSMYVPPCTAASRAKAWGSSPRP